MVVIAAWIIGALTLNLSLGLSAFAASAILLVAHAADDGAAVRGMPWGIIMMVCGVSVLIGVLEKTGGMELFTSLLARLASPSSINGVIAFVTGAISTYSSTSGVVLPAFLPTIPSLVGRLGGGDPLAIALSINVEPSLVDVSPLSTIGALAVAAVSDQQQSRELFRQLMTWGIFDDHHRRGLVSAICRRAGTSVATDYTDNTERIREIASSLEAASLMLRTSVASEPRARSAPSRAARERACRGVRGAKPLGKDY